MQQPSPKPKGAMDRVLQAIKTQIVSGELGPGEQIRQEEMAQRLHVSRVPLREAMNVLADQGLLLHRPYQGYFVAKRASSEHAQIRRMLHLLETELTLSLVWPDAEALARLRMLNAQMKDTIVSGDLNTLVRVNRQFHFIIFGLSPNNLILEEVGKLWSMIEPLMWHKFERAADRKQTVVEHERIIKALATKDRARCLAEIDHHRYSPSMGLSIEQPGVVSDLPAA